MFARGRDAFRMADREAILAYRDEVIWGKQANEMDAEDLRRSRTLMRDGAATAELVRRRAADRWHRKLFLPLFVLVALPLRGLWEVGFASPASWLLLAAQACNATIAALMVSAAWDDEQAILRQDPLLGAVPGKLDVAFRLDDLDRAERRLSAARPGD